MAGIVENNIVKMEWDKSGWLQTSAKKGKKAVFIFATKEYKNADGKVIPVFFTADTAFVFADGFGTADEDIWSKEDFIETIKSDMPGNFPFSLEQYVAVIDAGERECKTDILEKLGLTAYKEDIEARRVDISPYGAEETVKL